MRSWNQKTDVQNCLATFTILLSACAIVLSGRSEIPASTIGLAAISGQQEEAEPNQEEGTASKSTPDPSVAEATDSTEELAQEGQAEEEAKTEDDSDEEASKRPQETERQKAQREAVEKERLARGTSVKSLKTKLLEHSRTPDKSLDLTFDDLVFEMEKGERFRRTMLTKEINLLHKKKVTLSGYIRPSSKQKGITRFVFVRDNLECCFGPGAALFDCVLVKLAKDVETEYTVRPIKIEGEFYMKEYKGPDGKVWAVYRMKNGQLK